MAVCGFLVCGKDDLLFVAAVILVVAVVDGGAGSDDGEGCLTEDVTLSLVVAIFIDSGGDDGLTVTPVASFVTATDGGGDGEDAITLVSCDGACGDGTVGSAVNMAPTAT